MHLLWGRPKGVCWLIDLESGHNREWYFPLHNGGVARLERKHAHASTCMLIALLAGPYPRTHCVCTGLSLHRQASRRAPT